VLRAKHTHIVPTPFTIPYKFHAKRCFATWPQCPLARDDAYALLQSLTGTDGNRLVQWAVLAEEQHQDGSPHLHAVVCFATKVKTTNPGFLDLNPDSSTNFHGNYQTLKNLQKALTYLQKTGTENVTAYGVDLDSLLHKKGSQAAQAANILNDGGTLEDVRGALPGFFLLNMHRLMDYESYMKRRREDDFKELKCFSVNNPLETSATVTSIVEWLNQNIKKERTFKQPQLWIWSRRPNAGKTSLAMKLAEFVRIYWVPNSEQWLNDYEDDLYDVVVLDEYKGHWTVSMINKFAEGSPMAIPVKCAAGQHLKKHNVPMIVLSNYPIMEAYPNVSQDRLATVQARFLEVEVQEGELFQIKAEINEA